MTSTDSSTVPEDGACLPENWWTTSLTTIKAALEAKAEGISSAHARLRAIALLLPFTPLGVAFGFAPPPAFFAFLAAMVVFYLLLVEGAKRFFYRYLATKSAP